MSKNDDALRCAEILESDVCDLHDPTESAAHLRRLVRENEAKDALLRQALAAIVWECGSELSFYAEKTRSTISAIRQHLEGRA